MKNTICMLFFLFIPFHLISQEFIIPPEMYWLTSQIDLITPNNEIIKSDEPDEEYDIEKNKVKIAKYILPVFTHWNFSGNKGVNANTNYTAYKKGDKWILQSIIEDDPVFGMLIFDKEYNLLFEQTYGMSCWLMDAYWLTDSKIVAVGVYPSWKIEDDKAVIFFYVFEIYGNKIRRISYEYKEHLDYNDFHTLKMWKDLRPDYFW